MTSRRHSLRARIIVMIVGSVIATSLIFGLSAFAIAYTTEDRLFSRALADEVAHQTSAWQRSGALTAAKNPDIGIFRADQALPPDIRRAFAENPEQTEFYGREGRHYHVQRFSLDGDSPASGRAVAVMEVSRQLLVRPYRDSIIAALAGLSLFLALFMALFAWRLVNRAMRPLGDLARDVATTDSAIPNIDTGRYPANEIGTLAEALEHGFGRIRGFVDREQSFTRDASHELRTPLAVIRGAAEVIALNRDLPLPVAEPLRRIETAATDMALALDQLLAIAREGQGVPKAAVALRPLIDKAVSWSRLRYPNNAINVAITLDGNATVLVHPTSLQLVLNNLIGNCFQHVENGTLAIDFVGRCLSIADDGPGFEPGANPFAPFAKGQGSMGSGLGLDISRRLCDAAGISLAAVPGKASRGASFRLEF
jgi:signal transduction histidine kinase